MEDYLELYIRKRNFARTPEPGPTMPQAAGNVDFVVHRHDARSLHYDLRISYGGRLICFAVPKGFSYEPGVKRLAVHTEDHPIQYIGFEGIIPKGEYGAGAMNIWDAGTYRVVNADNPDAAIAKGELKLVLSGRRLRGEWHIVKLKTSKNDWLVFKAKDRYRKKAWDSLFGAIDLSGQPESEMPELVKAMRCKSSAPPFTDPGWGFEILFKGYRVFCFKNGSEIGFKNDGGIVPENDFLVEQLAALKEATPSRAIFDGLVIAVDENGLPSKTKLEQVLAERPTGRNLFFYMFDIVHFEDYDICTLPYSTRKALLALVMEDNGRILYVDFLKTEGELFAEEAKKNGVSGVLAKSLGSPYEPGESEHWKLIPLANPADPGAQHLGRITPKRIAVKITNPDKVFFPDLNLTKRDIVSYYNDVADFILPYLSNRIVHINRFPDGIYGESFYQKHLAEEAPEYLDLVKIEEQSQSDEKPYFICNNKAGLLYLANLGTIDFHSWFSSKEHLENPDWIAWDLDPKGAPFSDVVRIAKEIGKIVRGIELTPFVKTSGKSGLHILVAVKPVYTYDQARMFAESIARIVASENSKIATIERNIELRGKRVYIDFLQNRRGQTLVPPYSVRPVASASVSMPIEWEELDGKLSIEMFTVKSALERISQKGDLFERLLKGRSDLAAAIEKLRSFYYNSRDSKS